MLKKITILLAAALLVFSSGNSFCATDPSLAIEKQGAFAVGGTVIEAREKYNPLKPVPEAQTLHGDHANVNYQIPVNSKKHPLIFLHGAGQSMRTWQTTPDGRDGFQNIFLRAGYPIYLIDQPRRGDAGRATVPGKIEAKPDEQFWFGQFRLGIWPDFYKGSQFPQNRESLNQFFRQMTPNTAPFDSRLVADSLAALSKKIGPSVLVTHSQGGGPGWLTGIQSPNIKAIVSYEPGSGFVFPEGEVPAPIANASAMSPLTANAVPLKQFKVLTNIPIVIYYGDNIPTHPVNEPHKDYWRAARQMAQHFADAVNRHGGDATVVDLPSLGLKGNTHFPFSDKNNYTVADIMQQWLKEKKVD